MIADIDKVFKYIGDLDRAAFEADEMKIDAVERRLERITEVAFRLKEQAQELMPNQNWADIRGLGNRLRHEYDSIQLEIIWQVITLDLPDLRRDSAAVLARLEADAAD